MQTRAIDRFRHELRQWVSAYNKVHGRSADAAELLARLESRIGDRLVDIGAAYLNRWLITESDLGRGYFVRESDRPGPGGGQFTLTHRGSGKVDPCWELFVQLADYAWLRTVAERYGLFVRLEDALMDVTVRTADDLILYIENKVARVLAEELLQGMSEYGRSGFDLADEDCGNDPLRKAKYLVRKGARPLYFGLSAIGYKQLFQVEYFEDNRFELHPDERAFASVLSSHPSPNTAQPPPWALVDALAIEIQRLCPSCWVSVGSGRTAYNFYAPGEVNAIVVGVRDDGLLWTDLMRLGAERAARLSAALRALDIDVVAEKTWARWKRGGKPVDVADADPVMVATAIRNALQ